MTWQSQLKGDSISWLLESENPGVRYLALRDLLDQQEDDPDLIIRTAGCPRTRSHPNHPGSHATRGILG